MAKKRKFHPILGWLYFTFGFIHGLEISIENSEDAFFLKSTYNKHTRVDANTKRETFVITNPADVYKIKAGNGPFEVFQTISPPSLEEFHFNDRNINSTYLMHRDLIFDMDVSAHIVSRDISPKLPKLQVLIHASPKSSVSKKTGKSLSKQWCGQIYVQNGMEELTSVCVLNEKDGACVTGIDLPKEWWTNKGTPVNVSYSFLGIEQNPKCASASNTIIPGSLLSSENDSSIHKRFISILNLSISEKSYDEWKDQDILIDVPTEAFQPGDSFQVPIKLEAGSDLQVFVMKARVKHGLRITGVDTSEPNSRWRIHVDIKDRQKLATVTAFIKSRPFTRSQQIQDVFHWNLEVDEDLYDMESGRIVWSIEYQRVNFNQESYSSSSESRIVSTINIRSADQETLVPVLKVNEILNLAVLTGRAQIYPLKIYAVRDSGSCREVTQVTKCHSAEADVLKVSADCSSVYIDGGESRGSHNVTIIAKSGRVTAFSYVKVWYPEERLDIELSDSRLSHIRGWRVPQQHKNSRKRAVDLGLLSHPSIYLNDEATEARKCRLRLQQSMVEVFTRFMIQTPSTLDYYVGRRAFFKITDLVLNRLRMSDTRIATLNGHIVEGQSEGRTEIQILSPRNGRVIAAKEIRVGHDKVTIKGLTIRLVTGLTLDLQPSEDIAGALTATATIQSKLLSKYQEGVMNIELVFSDNASFPLKYVDPEDYFLDVSTLNLHVIGVARYVTPYQPHIVALGQGTGDLVKVLFKLGRHCVKKKSKALASARLYIDSGFSQKQNNQNMPDTLQSDAHFDTNRPSGRWDGGDKNAQNVHTLNMPGKKYDANFPSDKFPPNKFQDKYSGKEKNRDGPDTPVITLTNDNLGELGDSGVAKKEHIKAKEQPGLSPLEIGMYVLLAVFCVAISVFMINCIVFMMRYKRKRKPKKKLARDAISNANDWVWIGRATLERNAVNTRCEQTLMPEEDFNGNCTQPSSVSTSANNSAPSSNRNSTVSTYKGSECSIRITANPLSDAGSLPEESRSECGPQWDYEAMGMTYEQLLDYFDNLKESTA